LSRLEKNCEWTHYYRKALIYLVGLIVLDDLSRASDLDDLVKPSDLDNLGDPSNSDDLAIPSDLNDLAVSSDLDDLVGQINLDALSTNYMTGHLCMQALIR
jgi:hypothetical protein